MKSRLAEIALLAAVCAAFSIGSAFATPVRSVPGPLAGAGLPFVGLGAAGVYLYNRYWRHRG